ncbi:LA2681 family HEPN domain-containing protein [Cyanothece sp. BG0011]|uniref:LA2681 family HEPN domain-containing protein n=1 Tax=Cyanothece sp. BG0011 TaxID=2082950 RepID=UPI000D1FCE4D|nr:LA2681 family HEPN domain-containing protein [Cyanothece sp. BG0011]
MEDYSQELEELIALHKANEYEKALEKAQTLLQKYPNVQSIQFTCSSIFIFNGEKYKSMELVDKGIQLMETLYSYCHQIDPRDIFNNQLRLEINLSLGYDAKAKLLNRVTETKQIEAIKQKQKRFIQNTILAKKRLNPNDFSSLTNNYAALLSFFGRCVESVDYYCDALEVNKDNSFAKGNLGVAFLPLIPLSKKYGLKISFQSWQLLTKAIKNNDKLKTSNGKPVPNGEESITNFTKALGEIETMINLSFDDGLYKLIEVMKKIESGQDFQPSSYLKFIGDKRLILTVNPEIWNFKNDYKDDLPLPNVITTDIEKEKNKTLCYIFNQIKEEFATARHLYYQSFSQDQELIELSNITEYIDTLDSADFGFKSGFLKTSLRLAVDLLDKCAGFLNLYLELGNDPTKVTWNNVWYKKLKYKNSFDNSLNPIIGQKVEYNSYLKALVSVRKDLYDKEYEDFYPFKILRDYVTHQGITLHQNEVMDTSKVNYSLEQMQEETYFLLRMVKAAIIYLVGVVMIEEKEKEKKTHNIVNTTFYTKPGLSDRTIN